MKNILVNQCLLLFVGLLFVNVATSQDAIDNLVPYDVHKVYPPFSIEKETLVNAKTLSDIHQYFKPSWVKSYVSVEVKVNSKGDQLIMTSNNENISKALKEVMLRADVGSEISVDVKYYPDNTLPDNDVKLYDFSFIVLPDNDATYVGGKDNLKQFLSANAIKSVPHGTLKKYQLAAVTFSISEKGQVIDVKIKESSSDESVDKLLVKTLCNMQNWTPASYDDGTMVKQDFVMTIGDMESCTTNTLNIRNLEVK